MSKHIKCTQVSKYKYELSFNEIHLGDAEIDVDGFYYFWFANATRGHWDAWILREIADILDELNKEYNDKINEYFSTNKL